jgi:DNA invertase Pin-like site-specific DNA recombinase
MATKVTEQDKIQINELYLELKTYAAVARETGFSPSTVKKYIIPNYISQNDIKITPFNKNIRIAYQSP